MRKLRLFAVSGLTGTTLSLAIAGTAYAWHPHGNITKTVQDITTNSQVSDATDASNAITVAPGDTLKYTVVVSNSAQAAASHDNDMAFTKLTDTLPAGVELVSNPSQRTITEDLGTITPGKSVTKEYSVKVTSQTNGDVLTNTACFTGDSIVKDNPQSGCDKVVVKVQVPSYSCDLLSVTQGSDRTVTISDFKQTAQNGAAFKNVVIDWGDKSTPLTTTTAKNQTHQYATDGAYTVTATAHFTVNGQDKGVSSDKCVAKVNFKTTPTPPTTPPAELPNTGAGDLIVPAVLATVAGYTLYLFNIKRRANQN